MRDADRRASRFEKKIRNHHKTLTWLEIEKQTQKSTGRSIFSNNSQMIIMDGMLSIHPYVRLAGSAPAAAAAAERALSGHDAPKLRASSWRG